MKLKREQVKLIKDNCCIFCGTPTNEDLRKWFGKGGAGGTTKGGWDRYSSTGKKLGKCGDGEKGDAYAACLSATKARKLGKKGIFEGFHSYFLQDEAGNISTTHSVSAGLDYCGVSPILAHFMDENRIQVESASDQEALDALKTLAQKEGIILALESIHAFAYAIKLAPKLSKDKIIVVNGSGRGEKDLFITMKHFQEESLKTYINQIF